MKLRTLLALFAISVMSVMSFGCSSLASIHGGSHHEKSDPISGEWNATFNADSGDVTFTREMKLKLDGETVSGTFESDRTGPGTLKGTWTENKLIISMESAQGKMEVIALLKKGKLTGTWDVGHMQGKMEAAKKESATK